jgi:hypothetical protein
VAAFAHWPPAGVLKARAYRLLGDDPNAWSTTKPGATPPPRPKPGHDLARRLGFEPRYNAVAESWFASLKVELVS